MKMKREAKKMRVSLKLSDVDGLTIRKVKIWSGDRYCLTLLSGPSIVLEGIPTRVVRGISGVYMYTGPWLHPVSSELNTGRYVLKTDPLGEELLREYYRHHSTPPKIPVVVYDSLITEAYLRGSSGVILTPDGGLVLTDRWRSTIQQRLTDMITTRYGIHVSHRYNNLDFRFHIYGGDAGGLDEYPTDLSSVEGLKFVVCARSMPLGPIHE